MESGNRVREVQDGRQSWDSLDRWQDVVVANYLWDPARQHVFAIVVARRYYNNEIKHREDESPLSALADGCLPNRSADRIHANYQARIDSRSESFWDRLICAVVAASIQAPDTICSSFQRPRSSTNRPIFAMSRGRIQRQHQSFGSPFRRRVHATSEIPNGSNSKDFARTSKRWPAARARTAPIKAVAPPL